MFTTGTVTFNQSAFIARYPEFTNVSGSLLQLFFNEACLILVNNECSRVQSVSNRAILLNMLTAHIGALNCTRDPNGNYLGGAGGNGLVGKITNATEGSVSVATSLSSTGTSQQAWYAQTQYGVTYWAAMAKYRTMRYARPVIHTNGGYCGF